MTERGREYSQVNRPLFDEFVTVLGRIEWDVAFLQEAPPRWFRRLCVATRSSGAIVLTTRNFGHAARSLLADLNPDLIASNDGGSNQLLVKPPWRIARVERHTIARKPECRRMMLARLQLDSGRTLAVANVHASVDSVPDARDQLLDAAALAVAYAGELPLVFGGDLNQRPHRDPELFELLERRFDLAPPTAPHSIDHLLVRGLELVEPPYELPTSVRELALGDGSRIRLSDHECVVAHPGMK